jgi:CTP:molybdopterin cytidylyltransferase MocA
MGCLLKQGGIHSRLRIGAVLLAAGAGQRMGGVPKALIKLQGVPLVSRALVALSGAGVDEVVVVTGHARDAVEAAVASYVVTLAHNDDPSSSQQRSVRLGLAALSGPFDAVLVVPVDQPLLGANDIVELVGAFKKRPGGHVVVPIVEGARGNPIVLDAAALERILASGENLACRHLIEREPDLVHEHHTSNARFVTDLDTPDDVDRLARSTGWKLELPTLQVAA